MSGIDAASARPAWDYSALAASYELRAPYHAALFRTLADHGVQAAGRVADIGAGTGRMAAGFAALGARVDAVEPCAEMRAIGEQRCAGLAVRWHAATGERTGLASASYQVLSYGSSLNVLQPQQALAEACRLLLAGGRLVVAYNHRDLDDPLQQAIEQCIRRQVPEFDPGARRQDPTATLQDGGHFRVLAHGELGFVHPVDAGTFADGFVAHATLRRQAAGKFDGLLDQLRRIIDAAADPDRRIAVPFVTRWWIAGRADG